MVGEGLRMSEVQYAAVASDAELADTAAGENDTCVHKRSCVDTYVHRHSLKNRSALAYLLLCASQ